MSKRIIEEKITNLARVAPTPYPFCIAWSITFILIKLVMAWHIPSEAYSNIDLIIYFIIFVSCIVAWGLRLIIVKPKFNSFGCYIIYIFKQYEIYGWEWSSQLNRNNVY